jgi:hypothetical protein
MQEYYRPVGIGTNLFGVICGALGGAAGVLAYLAGAGWLHGAFACG